MKSKIGKIIIILFVAVAALGGYATSSSDYNVFKKLIIQVDSRRTELANLLGEDVNESLYTPESIQQYYQAVDRAEGIMNRTLVSGEDVDEATEWLEKALSNLVTKADKNELIRVLDQIGEIDIGQYTRSSYEALSSLIGDAEKMKIDENVSQEAVNREISDLLERFNGLLIRGNPEALKETVNRYSEISGDDYLTVTYSPFSELMQKAEAALASDDMTQTDLDTLLGQLVESYEALEKYPDKTNLLTLLEKLKGLTGDNYIEDTWEALQKAISTAQVVADNTEATSAEVDEALRVLKDGQDNLKKYTKGTYRINSFAYKETNNHVGNDLYYYYYLNGKEITNYEVVTYPFGTTVTIKCKIIEDDSRPDSGSGSVKIKLEDGYEASFTVKVKENSGRYAGNVEVFTVVVKVTMLGKE